MHNNYFFLRKLVPELALDLMDAKLVECFSQNKNELILHFVKNDRSAFLIADLNPSFSCIRYIDNYNRAKRNSVSLFDDLISAKIVSCNVILLDRSFFIEFDNKLKLVFKLHGNRSNCILFIGEKAVELFNKNLQGDLRISLSDLQKEPFDEKLFLEAGEKIKKEFPMPGNSFFSDYFHKIKGRNQGEHWSIFQRALEDLCNVSSFHIIKENGAIKLDLFYSDKVSQTFNDPIQALNFFYVEKKKIDQTEGKRNAILTQIKKRIKQLEHQIIKLNERLVQFDDQISYRMLGDILMANLNNIPTDASKVSLFNFYDNTTIEIKLNPPKTPQKIAEQYYRKSKKEGIEKSMLSESLIKKQSELKKMTIAVDEVEKAETYKEIAKYESPKTNSEGQLKNLPYKVCMFEGFEIRVGKNSKANDLLTFNYSFKDDLWLHARDTPGSHVLIKYKSDKKIPNSVIEKAAGIAAFYSKRKHEAHVPVIYTEKKYVRKRKSDRPGLVIVQKENVLMVTPENCSDHQDIL